MNTTVTMHNNNNKTKCLICDGTEVILYSNHTASAIKQKNTTYLRKREKLFVGEKGFLSMREISRYTKDDVQARTTLAIQNNKKTKYHT